MAILQWLGWSHFLTFHPLINLNEFHILLENDFPWSQRFVSNNKSFPAAELSISPTLTPSAPYSSISFNASGEFPNDLLIFLLFLSLTIPVK